jgi:regulator of RNase E activity RraA
MQLGANGAVVNGYSRDTRGILKLGFPAISWGRYAQDQRVRGRVIDYRCPIQFPNKTVVQPGDLIFGDMDGVLVIPYQHETDIIYAAIEKVRGENRVRKAIEAGMSATEAFEIFGIMWMAIDRLERK